MLDRQSVLQAGSVFVDDITKSLLSTLRRFLHDISIVERPVLREVFPECLVVGGVGDIADIDLGSFLVDSPLSLLQRYLVHLHTNSSDFGHRLSE